MFVGLTILYVFLFAIINLALVVVFPTWASFLHVPVVSSAFTVFNLAIFCGISIFLGKIKSFPEFKSAFDLIKPHETDVLAAVAIGVVLQFAGISLFGVGLSHLHSTHSLEIKKLPALFAPFFEEPAMRGFVYKAFRSSYGISISMSLVVLISLIFHTQVYGSLYQFVGIVALNVTLCFVKEKRLSLWNCIACHFAFNAVFVGIDQR